MSRRPIARSSSHTRRSAAAMRAASRSIRPRTGTSPWSFASGATVGSRRSSRTVRVRLRERRSVACKMRRSGSGFVPPAGDRTPSSCPRSSRNRSGSGERTRGRATRTPHSRTSPSNRFARRSTLAKSRRGRPASHVKRPPRSPSTSTRKGGFSGRTSTPGRGTNSSSRARPVRSSGSSLPRPHAGVARCSLASSSTRAWRRTE